jgi:hypothetical protein
MRSHNLRFVVAASVLLQIQSFSGLQPSSWADSGEGNGRISRLLAENIQDRRRAAEEIEREYNQLTNYLLDMAKRTRPDAMKDYESSWALAVRLLGSLRARSAVTYLVSEIGTKVQAINLGSGFLSAYPCAVALIHIGLPAVEEIVWRAAQRSSPMEKILIYTTLTSILGDDFAIMKLEDLAQKIHVDGKKNLMEIIGLIRDDRKVLNL